jgi:hypothetical protein
LGFLGLPFIVGAGFITSAKAEAAKPPTKELTLTEALAELNSAINSLLLKMQHSYPEMADAGLLWLLGYVVGVLLMLEQYCPCGDHLLSQTGRLRALAIAHEAQVKMNPFAAKPELDSVATAKEIRRYGAFAEAVYEDSESSFWNFIGTTAKRYVNREDYQLIKLVPASEWLAPAHAVLLDHKHKEILVCIRWA